MNTATRSLPDSPVHATAAKSGAADCITPALRRLEPWVGWSIAAYTAWLAVFAFPGVPAAWLFVLYAGLIGKWAASSPARRQSDMATRGIALVAGAYLLQTQTGSDIGGPGGVFLGWLSVTCFFYAFMLKPVWAAAIVALAMVEFTMVCLLTGNGTAPAELMAQASYLCIFPALLAMKFGAVMRRPDEILEAGRIDGSTALYNKAGFTAHGGEMLAESVRGRRPLSIAVFDCSDLLEVRSIYGSRIARKLLDRIVGKLTKLAGTGGLAARTGAAEFTVVLPMGHEKALAAIERALGNPMRFELDAGDSEIVLVPWFQVEAAGTDTDSVETLYQDLRREIADMAQREQRHQYHCQRERERHSRPMGIASMPGELGRDAVPTHLAATVPAHLVIS